MSDPSSPFRPFPDLPMHPSVDPFAGVDWEVVDRVMTVTAPSLAALAQAAGGETGRFYEGRDFRGLSLAGVDVRGVSLARADLVGARLREATIDATTRLDGATLDFADRIALAERGLLPPPDFDPDTAKAMILDRQAPPAAWTPWITELNFNKEKELRDLSPLSGLAALESLWLDSTPVSDLSPLSGLAALQTLWLDGAPVSDLSPLSGLAALESLWFDGTPVSDLSPLSGLAALKTLGLGGTPVSDLSPLSGLAALQTLWLSATPVSDLSPLSGLAALRELWLSATPVSDLSPLSGLAALQTLWLTATPVSDLSPLAGLPELRDVVIRDKARREALRLTLPPRLRRAVKSEIRWKRRKRVYPPRS